MNANIIDAMIRAAYRVNNTTGWKTVQPWLALQADIQESDCDAELTSVDADDEPCPKVTLVMLETCGLQYYATTKTPFSSLDLALVSGVPYGVVVRKMLRTTELIQVGTRLSRHGHRVTLWAPRHALRSASHMSDAVCV